MPNDELKVSRLDALEGGEEAKNAISFPPLSGPPFHSQESPSGEELAKVVNALQALVSAIPDAIGAAADALGKYGGLGKARSLAEQQSFLADSGLADDPRNLAGNYDFTAKNQEGLNEPTAGGGARVTQTESPGGTETDQKQKMENKAATERLAVEISQLNATLNTLIEKQPKADSAESQAVASDPLARLGGAAETAPIDQAAAIERALRNHQAVIGDDNARLMRLLDGFGNGALNQAQYRKTIEDGLAGLAENQVLLAANLKNTMTMIDQLKTQLKNSQNTSGTQ
jgi:hypothetical protein